MARFTLPRDLYHGKGALEALKTFEGKKAIICVGGGSMKRFGFLERAKQYLEEAGMEVQLFEGIEPDPSVETVMKGAKADRCDRRRFADRCGKGYVDQIRISGYHI